LCTVYIACIYVRTVWCVIKISDFLWSFNLLIMLAGWVWLNRHQRASITLQFLPKPHLGWRGAATLRELLVRIFPFASRLKKADPLWRQLCGVPLLEKREKWGTPVSFSADNWSATLRLATAEVGHSPS